jgi:hypothetical protein
MGVSKLAFDKFKEFKGKYFNSHMKLLELGDQDVIFEPYFNLKMRELEGKNFKKWASYDLHSRSGVTIKDLSIVAEDTNKWDIITNFGTSEHVEPEIGQYNCWKNMHNWLNLDGYIIHEIPEVGSWPNHCRYYTDKNFFENFQKIGYEIVENSTIYYQQNGNLSFAILKKKIEYPFFDIDLFNSIIHIDYNNTSSIIAKENNPKNLLF